jgi:hypothetical protein
VTFASTLPIAALAAAASMIAAPSARAGVVAPQLTFGVTVSGDAPQSVTSTAGVADGHGAYDYVGSLASSTPGSSWYVNWDLLGNDTAVLPNNPSISTSFVVGNTGNTTRTFQVQVTFASPVQVTPGVTSIAWLTTLSGVLNSSHGAVASLVGQDPAMFQGQINGTGVVLNNPSVQSTTTSSTFGNSANSYFGAIPNGPNVSTIGYLMTFSLSAHSTAVFNGSWAGTVVPAPGAVALLGAAGLAAGRRRRGRA